MKVIIIGNNVSGTFTAQNIRQQNKDVEIQIFTKEKYPYYTRVYLPQVISGKMTIEKLIVFQEEWYRNNNIELYLEHEAIDIDLEEKKVIFRGKNKETKYDKLILALGSTPNIPPIKNAKEMKVKGNGVFTLRTIDDLNTTVVEFFPRLLPRQTDEECSSMLKREIEKRGINVILGAATEEILGEEQVTGIKLKDGNSLKADIVLIQAGIVPSIELAKKVGIKTNRVYAVGDCIEFQNQIWGIIPACIEQSKIIAQTVLGYKNISYKGTTPKNTLKVIGLDLTSIGIVDPKLEEGAGWEILKKSDKTDCCYDKIVLKNNKVKGAILFGDTKAISYIYSKMDKEIDREELKKILELYTFQCNNCGALFDELKMGILFKDLPEDWKCQNCGGPKDNFKKVEA
ncbi:MAG: FAD-dependent oxidoreductase [Promethearchaeota archaeon]